MLKQKVVLLALAVSLNGLHFAVAQSNTESAGPAHIIQMVNLVANVDKSIDTKKAKAGDPFDAKVATTVKLDDGTDVPSGSVLEGHHYSGRQYCVGFQRRQRLLRSQLLPRSKHTVHPASWHAGS
jgi:hypothetical protein